MDIEYDGLKERICGLVRVLCLVLVSIYTFMGFYRDSSFGASGADADRYGTDGIRKIDETTLPSSGSHDGGCGNSWDSVISSPETLGNPLFINALPISLSDVSVLMNTDRWPNQVYGIMLSGNGLPLYKETLQVEFYQIPEVLLSQISVPNLALFTDRGETTAFEVEKMFMYSPRLGYW